MSNTFQDVVGIIIRQSSAYESPIQEIPQAIPVTINHGCNNRLPQTSADNKFPLEVKIASQGMMKTRNGCCS